MLDIFSRRSNRSTSDSIEKSSILLDSQNQKTNSCKRQRPGSNSHGDNNFSSPVNQNQTSEEIRENVIPNDNSRYSVAQQRRKRKRH